MIKNGLSPRRKERKEMIENDLIEIPRTVKGLPE
jgi:hypothetical protein